jgi:hypothetical protein
LGADGSIHVSFPAAIAEDGSEIIFIREEWFLLLENHNIKWTNDSTLHLVEVIDGLSEMEVLEEEAT